MITATGIGPLAPRGTVRVPPSSRAPLRMVYGDSTTAGGAVVSTGTTSCGATMARARLRAIMLFPLPEDVRLHDGDRRHDDDRRDQERQECAAGQQRRPG